MQTFLDAICEGNYDVVIGIYNNLPLFEEFLTHINSDPTPEMIEYNNKLFKLLDGVDMSEKHSYIYEKIMDLNPQNKEIPLLLAGYYEDMCDNINAEKYYNICVNNGDHFGMYYFGRYFDRLGNKTMAYKYYKMGTMFGSHLSAGCLCDNADDSNKKEVFQILREFNVKKLKNCQTLEAVENHLHWMGQNITDSDPIIVDIIKDL